MTNKEVIVIHNRKYRVLAARSQPVILSTPGANITATLETLNWIEGLHRVRQQPVAVVFTADDRRYMAMDRRLQNQFGK